MEILFEVSNSGAFKTPDGTTGKTTSHLTRLPNSDSQVIGYSYSTRLSKYDSLVAGDCSPFFKKGKRRLQPSSGGLRYYRPL